MLTRSLLTKCRAVRFNLILILLQHLNTYLDGAGEDGFIYVSMGTSVNPKTMPPAMLKVFVAAFSQLPYRILWKFDSDLRGLTLPANVRIENWLPQQDILSECS